MRGLTPVERLLLQRRIDNAPMLEIPPESPWWDAATALASMGRIRHREHHHCSAGYCLVPSITDMGRLALRVCPAGET